MGFGPVCALTEPGILSGINIDILFGNLSGIYSDSRALHELLSEITPLELALAVRSGPVGAHSDDKLAAGRMREGRRRRRRRGSCTFVKV